MHSFWHTSTPAKPTTEQDMKTETPFFQGRNAKGETLGKKAFFSSEGGSAGVPQVQKEDDTTVESEEADLLPYSCLELATVLRRAIRTSFLSLFSLPEGTDYLSQFMDEIDRVVAEDPSINLSPAQSTLLDGGISDLSTVEASLPDTFYFDYGNAPVWLSSYLGMPEEVAGAGGRVSYGVGKLVTDLSREISYFLAGKLRNFTVAGEEGAATCPRFSLENLQQLFTSRIARWGEMDALLEIEFYASIEHLMELKWQFVDPEVTPEERLYLGPEIGRVSRYILLLDTELESLRNTVSGDEGRPTAGDPTELEDFLESNAATIEQMQAEAATEEDTLEALGNDPELLRDTAIEDIYPDGDPILSVTNEAAFPETTDAATLRMMNTLAERVTTQQGESQQLREKIIPASPSYSLEEFMGVHEQWMTFFNPRARDLDMQYRQMDELISGLYGAMGYAGVEGGVGRWMLMNMVKDNIHGLGDTNNSFADTINAQGPRRDGRITGSTANTASYEAGELYQGARGSRNAAGERRSRDAVLNREQEESVSGFNHLRNMRRAGAGNSYVAGSARNRGLLQSSANGPVFLLPQERHQQLWSFLSSQSVTTQSGDEITVHEQRTIAPATAEYLLAETQRLRTLQSPHQPGIGESGSIEQGRANSANIYLEGSEQPNADMEQATALRRTMAAARSDADLEEGADPAAESVRRLTRDLEEYLNAYFTNNQEMAPKVLAVLRISVLEHNGDRAFFQHFTPQALAKALAFSLGIAGIVSALRFIPYVGIMLSYSIGKIIKRYGIATDVGSVITIAGFFNDVGKGTTTFHDARQWGYLAKFIMSDIGQLLQGLAVSSLVDSFQFARSVRSQPHTSVNEVMRDLEPLTQNTEMREILRQDLETIRDEAVGQGGGEQSSPKLELIDDILLRLNQSMPDKPITPDLHAPREGGSDSIVRANETVRINGENHGLSVTFRDGGLVIRICSDCDGFIGALRHAEGIAADRNLTEAEGLIRALREDTANLQGRMNRNEVDMPAAETELNGLKDRLKNLAATNPEVSQAIDASLNRTTSSAMDEGLPVTRGLTELAGGNRAVTEETTRFVETADGDIIRLDLSSLPPGLHIGEGFTVGGRQYKYVGNSNQRALQEEGFSPADLRGAARRAAVQESHDMGVERGRLQAAEENIRMIDFNPPDQYLGLFGKGIDDLGQRGALYYILEWKGGSSGLGSSRHGQQMTAQWVGTKLAEFNFFYRNPTDVHPLVTRLLRAARRGQLRGRGYSTKWNETRTEPLPTERITAGPLAGGEATYGYDAVRAAFDTRTAELSNQHGL